MKMIPIRFTIPIEPKTKKNSMRPYVGRNGKFRGLGQSKIYQQYEADCLRLIPGWVKIQIAARVNVKAVYYRASERDVDLINLHAALHDILVKAGVLADDKCKIVVSTDGSYVDYDKEHPRTEIEIAWLED